MDMSDCGYKEVKECWKEEKDEERRSLLEKIAPEDGNRPGREVHASAKAVLDNDKRNGGSC